MKTDIPIPAQMQNLPVNKAGYVVPAFVAKIDGEWDFRVVEPNFIAKCFVRKLCWICGGPRETEATFVIGPMCSINRVSAEPPSHLECAEYAAKVCPFLTRPTMIRRTNGLPEERSVAGQMIERNPGVTLLWTSSDYQPFRAGDGVLFDVGTPKDVSWWAEGREATHDEILASIDSGYPILLEAAQVDGKAGIAELERRRAEAMKLAVR